MKKLIIIALVLCSVCTTSSAQLRISVNIGSQPTWGPAGYDHVDYYYLPDMDMYYYVPKRQYIYLQGGNWRFSYSLPSRYKSYDLNSAYKVVINEPRPYNRASYYRNKYSNFKGNHGQPIIRNSHEEKYWQIKDHPDHGKWNNKNKNNNGHH